jgi:hypothetical protein
MRLRTKAPAPRSTHSPSRTAGRGLPGRRLRGPETPLRQAIRQVRRHDDRSGRIRLQQGPERQSRPAERSTPLIPLTFRAMNSTPHAIRSSAQSALLLLSVLALLAFACFPILAQASESVGPVYETEVPTVNGHTTPPTHSGGGTPAHSSSGGNPSSTGSTPSNGSGSGSGGNPSSANSNPSTGEGGGTGSGGQGNGSTANGKGGNQQVSSLSNGQQASSQKSADDSSSPLIPILIAIAVLAAISIGVVVVRQRRQRGSSGAQVSPKAS